MDVLGISELSQGVHGVSDLPPHIVRLARMIARDCHAPGLYTVSLRIPEYLREPISVEIQSVSGIVRQAEVERKAGA